jgi:hypothetical protein
MFRWGDACSDVNVDNAASVVFTIGVRNLRKYELPNQL